MKIKLNCPVCERALKDTMGMRSASTIIKRRCKCGKRWQVRITPLRQRPGLGIYDVLWADTTEAEGERALAIDKYGERE